MIILQTKTVLTLWQESFWQSTVKNGKTVGMSGQRMRLSEKLVSRTTNARCPKCHKRMEMLVKGKEETFVCAVRI